MELLTQFHFIRPWWLLSLPIGWVLICLLWRRSMLRSGWSDIIEPHLLVHLRVGQDRPINRLFLGLWLIGWLLLSIVVSGPSWVKAPQVSHSSGENVVYVFDLSRSMDSNDLLPSRITRARFKLMDLVAVADGQNQGIVVFAGDAFIVTPLTDDADTLSNLIGSLDTNTVPVQGSRTDLALLKARELLNNAGAKQGNIVLFTDGVHRDTASIAKTTTEAGYDVSVIAIGTARGAPVPLASGGLLKDGAGNIVVPSVNFEELASVARSGGGVYTTLVDDNQSIENRLTNAIVPFGKGATSDNSSKTGSENWQENGIWLIIPLLLIASLGFRRGWFLTPLLAVALIRPSPVVALDWDDLWLRKDQQAAAALANEDYETLSQNPLPNWKGIALYRQNQYEDAIKQFEAEQTAQSHYNLGNSLALSGELEKAIDAYNTAIAMEDGFEDAKFNKKLVEDLLRQQRQNQQSSQQRDQKQEQEQEQETGDNTDQNQPEPQSSSSQSQHEDPSNSSESEQGHDTKQQDSGEPDSKQQEPDEPEPEHSGQTEEAEETMDPKNADPEPNPSTLEESKQALNQWLRQIPDDPGGLLRRKFAIQHQQSQRADTNLSSERIQEW